MKNVLLYFSCLMLTTQFLWGQTFIKYRPNDPNLEIIDLTDGSSRTISVELPGRLVGYSNDVIAVRTGMDPRSDVSMLMSINQYGLMDKNGKAIATHISGVGVHARPGEKYVVISKGEIQYEGRLVIDGLEFYDEKGELAYAVELPAKTGVFAEVSEDNIAYNHYKKTYRIFGDSGEGVVYEINLNRSKVRAKVVKDGYLVSDDGKYSSNGRYVQKLFKSKKRVKEFKYFDTYDYLDGTLGGSSRWIKGRPLFYMAQHVYSPESGTWLNISEEIGKRVLWYDYSADAFIVRSSKSGIETVSAAKVLDEK